MASSYVDTASKSGLFSGVAPIPNHLPESCSNPFRKRRLCQRPSNSVLLGRWLQGQVKEILNPGRTEFGQNLGSPSSRRSTAENQFNQLSGLTYLASLGPRSNKHSPPPPPPTECPPPAPRPTTQRAVRRHPPPTQPPRIKPFEPARPPLRPESQTTATTRLARITLVGRSIPC